MEYESLYFNPCSCTVLMWPIVINITWQTELFSCFFSNTGISYDGVVNITLRSCINFHMLRWFKMLVLILGLDREEPLQRLSYSPAYDF